MTLKTSTLARITAAAQKEPSRHWTRSELAKIAGVSLSWISSNRAQIEEAGITLKDCRHPPGRSISAIEMIKAEIKEYPDREWSYTELADFAGVSRQWIYQLIPEIEKLGCLFRAPSPSKRNIRQPCIYLIKCTNWYKIGYTVYLLQRLNSLQVGCPYAHTSLMSVEFDNTEKCRIAELNLHSQAELAGFKRRHEWFCIPTQTEAIQFFNNSVAKIQQNNP